LSVIRLTFSTYIVLVATATEITASCTHY